MCSLRRARPRPLPGTKHLSWLGIHWQDHSWTRSDESSSAATAVRCACRKLGLKSLMSDLSLEVKAELVTDRSACKGLCSRRCAGKNRHIHCLASWLQHAVARRQIAITWRAGKRLSSRCRDRGGHPEDTMWRLLGMFGLAKGEGRAKQAED